MLTAQALRALLQVASLAILSRMLQPADFGLIAMAAVVLGALDLFKDGGLSLVTIQHPGLTVAQLDKLFWLNAGLGLALAAVIVATAPAVAAFYGEPRLRLVTVSLSGFFLLSGLSVQHLALLQRQMRFVTHTSADLLARPIAIAAATVTAWCGLGYWALVTQQLTLIGCQMILAWAFVRWIPSFRRRDGSVRPMVASGAHVLLGNIATFLSRNADDALIGRFFGSTALGYYAHAYRFFMLPLALITTPMNAVVIPALSRLQNDTKQFREVLLAGLGALAFITAPVAAALLVMSDEIIAVALGPGWEQSGKLMRYLAISALVQPYGATVGWLFVSLGRMRARAAAAWVGAVWLVTSFVVGLRFGVEGVAISYGIASVLWAIPGLAWAARGSPVKLGELLREISRPLVAAAAAGIAAHHVMPFAGNSAPHRLLLGSCAGSIVYLAMQLGPFRQYPRILSVYAALRAKTSNELDP